MPRVEHAVEVVIDQPIALRKVIADYEHRVIAEYLSQHGQSERRVARLLGYTPGGLRTRLKQLRWYLDATGQDRTVR